MTLPARLAICLFVFITVVHSRYSLDRTLLPSSSQAHIQAFDETNSHVGLTEAEPTQLPTPSRVRAYSAPSAGRVERPDHRGYQRCILGARDASPSHVLLATIFAQGAIDPDFPQLLLRMERKGDLLQHRQSCQAREDREKPRLVIWFADRRLQGNQRLLELLRRTLGLLCRWPEG